MASAVLHGTSLLDVLEIQSLHELIARHTASPTWRKDMSVLSKRCRSSGMAMALVRLYSGKLSSLPSRTEPLPVVANLLEHARLNQLCMEITVPAPGGLGDLLDINELAANLELFHEFLSTSPATFQEVTSLQITLVFKEVGSSALTLSSEAGSALAILLATYMPKIRFLNVPGSVGNRFFQEAGHRLAHLTSLRFLEGDFPVEAVHNVLQDFLPFVTHLTVDKMYFDHIEYISENLQHSSVTHLEVGKFWMEKEEDWRLLPAGMTHVTCEQLPENMSNQLQLPALESVQLSCKENSWLPLRTVLSLLRAAPNLMRISFSGNTHNSLEIEDRICTSHGLAGLQLLHARMAAGFTLAGITVVCNHGLHLNNVLNNQPVMNQRYTMAEFIRQLPDLPAFDDCTLSYGNPFLPGDGGNAQSLPALAQALPGLQILRLKGGWLGVGLEDRGLWPKLKMLDLSVASLTPQGTFSLVRCMPQLRELHTMPVAKKKVNQFIVGLKATQVVAAGGAAAGSHELGHWKIHTAVGALPLREPVTWSRSVSDAA